MPLAAGPHWLGSPQHAAVGAIAAAALYAVARSRRLAIPAWVAFVLAVSLVCTAELILELIEYPAMYAGRFHASAYYDTLADMANSLAGALVGATGAMLLLRRLGRT